MQTQTQQRLKKFHRQPERLPLGFITDRSLALIATVARYQIIPTSLIQHLNVGSHQQTIRHLQRLYHHGFINRFSTARFGGSGEICYYLDNPQSLELLSQRTNYTRESLPWDLVHRNRKNPYSALHNRNEIRQALGRLLFVDHELMITRFHAHLQLACQHSEGQVELTSFRQGPELHADVYVPKLLKDPKSNKLYESDTTERLPHRPDALFSLHFPHAPEGQREAHFFYEADRRRSKDPKRFRKKLRAYFHCIARQKKHTELYNIPRVRAVLVETLDDAWVDRCRRIAAHETVSPKKPTRLFWFASSQPFTELQPVQQGSQQRMLPAFLSKPETLFDPVWKTPVDDQAFSLLD